MQSTTLIVRKSKRLAKRKLDNTICEINNDNIIYKKQKSKLHNYEFKTINQLIKEDKNENGNMDENKNKKNSNENNNKNNKLVLKLEHPLYKLAKDIFNQRIISNPSYNYTILNIEYVVNETLLHNFEKKKNKLLKKNPDFTPNWGFHGTPTNNIDSIIKNGFYMPDHKKYKKNVGLMWGKGIYVSKSWCMTLNYICYNSIKEDNIYQIFLCRILTGKSYIPSTFMPNAPCQKGYDSHFCRNEFYVLFNSNTILPVFLLTIQKT